LWKTFRKASSPIVTHVSKKSVDLDSTGTQFEVDVPNHSWALVAPTGINFCFNVRSNVIVIRDDYMEAFNGLLEHVTAVGLKTDTVQTNPAEAAICLELKIFILTGQPGIGVYHIRPTLHHN
jgi:hypothetical protein